MERRIFVIGVASAAATPLLAGGHGRLGAFVGVNGHTCSGTAEIAPRDGGFVVNLLDDFVFDGGPDPKVALGRGGYDPATLMGPLQSNTGASSYAVPTGIDPGTYDEVWIWCEQFDVGLAVAAIG